jgi:hypothetical protein
MPIMFVVTILAAQWVVRRFSFSPTPARRLSIGFVALGLLLAAESVVAFWLRRLTVAEYFASRDPVAGTVYFLMLSVFAVMPLLVRRKCNEERTELSALLDQFIARPDVRERHQISVHAPSEMVFEAACSFDLQSIWMVRSLFWFRGRVLGAKMRPARRPAGLIAEMLAIGWGRLAADSHHLFVAGAVCQPWQANVVFSPIPPEQFAAFAEPDQVKIAWTLETKALGPVLTRFATETRAVATDDEARMKFRRYWHIFGIGVLMIRLLLLTALRREAERRWQMDRWSLNQERTT